MEYPPFRETAVFHGTLLSTSLAIEKDGFARVGFQQQFEVTGREYGLSAEDLLDNAARNGGFAGFDSRTSDTYVTGDREVAARYASTGPESRWEALWSVYRIRHGLEADWMQSEEGALWVLARCAPDEPRIVIEARARLENLYNERGTTAAEIVARIGTDAARGLLSRVPQWRAAPEDVAFVSAHTVPIQVTRPTLSFMADVPAEELSGQIADGVWGEPGGIHIGSGAWYPLDRVWARISEARRAELESLAEAPIRPFDSSQATAHDR